MHDRQREFFKHVWDHTKDEFFESFVNPRKLTDGEQKLLKEIICILCNSRDKEACDKIYKLLKEQTPDDSIIPLILQLVGSTRNKIITDLKAMLSNTRIKIPAEPQRIVKNPELLQYAEKYMTSELKRVFSTIIDKDCKVDDDTLYIILEILNQSTWSGFVRQERAKRTGHYAELRIAKELDKMNIQFEPRAKLHNPLTKDAKFQGVSYDIVVPDQNNPKICIKATTHTSNIGQYGESKDSLEVKEAKEKLGRLSNSKRPVLVSFIDGIGLRSNIAGLKDVLNDVDEFIQFKTMWKIIVLNAHTSKRIVKLWLPDPDEHQDFLARYESSIELIDHDSKLTFVGEGGFEQTEQM